MSSPDLATRHAAHLAVAVLSTLMLSGSFRPMYASTDNAAVSGLTQKLASIDISDPGEDPATQLIRSKLSFNLSGGGTPAPRYRLTLAPSVNIDTALVDALEHTPKVKTRKLTCDFTLYPLSGDKKMLFKGKGSADKSYNRSLQRFAALGVMRDAQEAAADVLADQMRARLAIYLPNIPVPRVG
jgi:LPS-assembly lipoprotein